MSMKNYENPATRLVELLERAKSIPVHVPFLEGLSELFETSNDYDKTIVRFAKFIVLSEEVVTTLNTLFTDGGTQHEYWQPRLKSILESMSLNSTWGGFSNGIDQNMIVLVKVSETLINTKIKATTAESHNLKNIKQDFESLLVEIMDSDEINIQLKIFVTRKIREIITSIEEYQLTGVSPILDAIDSSIGHCITNPEYKEFVNNSSLGKRLAENLGAAANAITVITGLPQLTTQVTDILAKLLPI